MPLIVIAGIVKYHPQPCLEELHFIAAAPPPPCPSVRQVWVMNLRQLADNKAFDPAELQYTLLKSKRFEIVKSFCSGQRMHPAWALTKNSGEKPIEWFDHLRYATHPGGAIWLARPWATVLQQKNLPSLKQTGTEYILYNTGSTNIWLQLSCRQTIIRFSRRERSPQVRHTSHMLGPDGLLFELDQNLFGPQPGPLLS